MFRKFIINQEKLVQYRLAALEADLTAWAADLRREEDEKKVWKGKKEEEEGERTSPIIPFPSDLPPLDNIEVPAISSNKVKKGRSRDSLTTITGGQRSPGLLITDISQNKVTHKSSRDLQRVMGGKKSPGSLIEVIEDSGNENSRSKVIQKPPEPLVVSHVSGGSVIQVTIGHAVGQEGQGASSRQVEGLLREAERQQGEGDLLSASLTYNKVLSVCPQQAEARRALDNLLKGNTPPAPAATPPAAPTPLVQEVE